MNNLIIFTFLAICASAVYAGDAKMEQVMAECSKEGNLTPEQLEMVKKQDFPEAQRASVPENVKCFLNCAQTKMGLVLANGQVDPPAMEKVLNMMHNNDAAKVAELKEKCKTLNGATPCEKAFNLAICMHS